MTAGPYTAAVNMPNGWTFTTAPTRIACCNYSTPATSAQQLLAYEVPASTGVQPQIGFAVINESSSIGISSNAIVGYTTQLASAPFIQGGLPYVFTVFPSKTQQTLFLQSPFGSVSGQLQVVGKFFAGSGGSPSTVGCLSRPQQLLTEDASGNTWALGTLQAMQDVSVSGSLSMLYGLSELALNFAPTPGGLPGRVPNAQLGGNSVFAAGGQVYAYDGQQVAELGFNVYPEPPTVTFQTSQLALILDSYSPASPSIGCSLYFPDNAAAPGTAAGSLVTPGEYIVFNGYSSSGLGDPLVVVWFSVDGKGSAPSWVTTQKTIEVSLYSQMTAIEAANAFYYTTAGQVGSWTIAYTSTAPGSVATSQRVVLTNSANSVSPPALNRAPVVAQVAIGSSSTPPITTFSACPASLISGGQFFYVGVSQSISFQISVQTYIWFKVAGVGTDPTPFSPGAGVPYLSGVEVDLTGTETEAQVATAVANALNASLSADLTASSTGPTVT
ncbi:MAG: hypothetical protein KGR26_11285, partial [Cyanobacteria bacterium REEB65]|nr:hypothetical protein [Cyanobacteria bacterium REEB65]